MKKCPFCEKETKPSAHIYSCAKKTNFEGTKNDIKYEFIKYNNKGLCIKEIFIRKYTDELYSIPDFTKEYDTDNKTILFLIEYYGLKKRTISESAKLISVHKYKKTCQEKYGCDNASKSETIKEKKKETFISNYGVDNIFKEEKFKKFIKENNFAWMYDDSNKSRSKNQSKSIKYYWENISDERRTELSEINKISKKKYWENLTTYEKTKKMKAFLTKTSSLESRISSIMINNNIPFSTQVFIGGRSFDFKFTNTNILLEVQGDFWHGNPEKYLENDVINMPGKGQIKAVDLWENDLMKKDLANELGYHVVYLWENDMKHLSDEELFNKIIKFLKNEIKKNN